MQIAKEKRDKSSLQLLDIWNILMPLSKWEYDKQTYQHNMNWNENQE